jgi:hypothetical protein
VKLRAFLLDQLGVNEDPDSRERNRR